MNVTIVGGGNVGTQFAVHCSSTGNEVTIYTSKPEKFKKELMIVDENNDVVYKGKIVLATNDPERAFKFADLIFITYPSFKLEEISNIIYPYVKKNVKICLVPGTGGGEWYFRKCIEKGAIIFGLQRVPSVARLVKYGEVVKAVGYRKELKLASIPNKYGKECKRIIDNIFKMNTIIVPNYLNITLTPSNPILHTTRLKTLFDDYYDGKVYDKIPLFYEDWNDKSSELLLKCDNEVQKICKKIDVDLSEVKSLKEHYESKNEQELTNKMRSIESLKGLETPNIQLKNGYIPDFSSRYFSADFPYGLEILVQVGNLAGVEIPNMKETLEWYKSLNLENKYFDFSKIEVNTLSDLLDLYKL